MRVREHTAITLMLLCKSCHTVYIRTGPCINRLIVVPSDMHFVRTSDELLDDSPLKR